MEETSPLLGRSNYDAEKAKEVLPINKKKKYQILGGLAAITSSLAFAIYNTLVKRYHQDVVDVLLIRSMFEICVFGSFAKWKGHKFWPDKSLCDTPKMYYLKCFLLVFQVSYKTYLGYFLFISKYDFCTGIYNKNIFHFRVFVLEWL